MQCSYLILGFSFVFQEMPGGLQREPFLFLCLRNFYVDFYGKIWKYPRLFVTLPLH